MYFGLGYATNSWKITQTDYCKIEKGTYSSFKDDIWGANLADMQLVSKFNKGIRFSLCVIDIYSKYACVVPLKGKIGVTAFNLFQIFWMIQRSRTQFTNQIKYGWIKEVNLMTILLKNG